MPFKDSAGNWCADYTDEHGKRRRPSLAKQGVRTEAQAKIVEARLIARVDAIKKGIHTGERNPESLTLRTALEWYLALPKTAKSKNIKSLTWTLEKHLVGDFADMRIDLVKPGHVAAWLDEREAECDLSERTVNRLRAYLSGMFSRLIDRDLLVGENPCRRVERRDEDDPDPRLLPPEAVAVIMDNAANRAWSLVFNIAAYTGMRRGEIRKLSWSDVDFARGVISVDKTKTRVGRTVPIHPELRPLLEERKGSGLVVPKAAWGQAGAITRAAMERGGFEVGDEVDACFHSIRHTFSTHAVDCGADPWAIEWIAWGPPPGLGTMARKYAKPVAALARELAKLQWPRSGDSARRNSEALEARAKLLEDEARDLRARAAEVRPAAVVSLQSLAENRQSAPVAGSGGER